MKTKSKIDISKFEEYQNPLDKVVLDPSYEYKKVIFTYREGWGRIKRYEKNGWEIVVSPSSDGSERLEPVLIEEDVTHKAVLMRCLKTRRLQNEKDKDILNQRKIQRSVKHINQQGFDVRIEDRDIDINNLQD